MEPIWLKNYPQGVDPEIDITQYTSLNDVFEEACRNFRNHKAFTNLGVALTYAELDRLSAQFASFLQNEWKLKKGDGIALQMPNLLQYPVALFGALRAGLHIVNVNPLYTPREMEHQLKDSGAKAILIMANFAAKLEQIIQSTSIKYVMVTEIGDAFPLTKRILFNFVVKYIKRMVPSFKINHTNYCEALKKGSQTEYSPVEMSLEDVAFLQYTGGTTGVSKGAILTHHNVIANLEQISQWMKPRLEEGREIIITALPLYHIFSLTVNCLGLFKRGMTNVLITNPRDIPALVKEIKSVKPTVMTVVSTLLAALLDNKEFNNLKLDTLKVSVAGGMALKGAVAKRWREKTGTSVIEGYGLTEASPVVSCNPLDGRDQLGTIGLPLPSTQIKIVDENDLELPLGQEGELLVKGPQVMKGYFNQSEETKKVLTQDGWLKTGDMAMILSDGFLKIVDRKKDMILVSGFNVYPNEVEEVILHHPKVAECAAIGVPDEHSGEVVKLFVVPRDASLTKEELFSFAKAQLTNYKRPKEIEFRKELPKTNVGKILRRALRDVQQKPDSGNDLK